MPKKKTTAKDKKPSEKKFYRGGKTERRPRAGKKMFGGWIWEEAALAADDLARMKGVTSTQFLQDVLEEQIEKALARAKKWKADEFPDLAGYHQNKLNRIREREEAGDYYPEFTSRRKE